MRALASASPITFEDLCHGKEKQAAEQGQILVAQPLFRSRQEQAKKKGSYRREASRNWEASFVMAA